MTIPKEARINERLRAREIRVIGAEGQQFGVLSVDQGLKLAREKGQDLVEVAPQATPPVCRIMNYGKFKYDQTKKAREARRRQKMVEVKEVKVRPKIEEHDYQVKLRNAQKFLKRGDKVKVTLMFRGREVVHPEIGRRILNRLIEDVKDLGQIERPLYQEGKNLITIITPK